MGKKEMSFDFEGLGTYIKEFLAKRDIVDQETLDRFLHPTFDHLRSPDTKLIKVVEEIKSAISEEKKILIWGDEDMDGITSTLLLLRTLQELSPLEIETYIPSRRKEGYGLSKKGIKFGIDKGIDLIITVDSGINSVDEVEYAKKNGLDVIITDHHEPKKILPDTLILNPKISPFGYDYLAGGGVAFKLSDALFEYLDSRGTKEWTGRIPEIPILAMIGTISDRVPRLDENRILIEEGLKALKITENPSLSLLREKGNIGVAIEPLNSGREQLTWDFFTASTKEKAIDIYSELEAKHGYWSLKARENFLSLKDQIQEGHLVLFDPDLDVQYASSVANRTKDYRNHPVFVVYAIGDTIRGEGRAPGDFDLLAVLESVNDLLLDYGGHKPACGFTLKEGKVEEFRERVEPLLSGYQPKIHYDAKAKLEDITPDLQSLIMQMRPFGKDNYQPVFLIENVNYRIEDGAEVLSDSEVTLKMDKIKEKPPLSEVVDAYVQLDGEDIILLSWEWTERE